MSQPIKVSIDHTLCEGHAKCMDLLPEVFEVRDDDHSYVVVDEIPESLREKLLHAARVCPRAAIKISE